MHFAPPCPVATDPAPHLDYDETTRLRNAALRAQALFPGPLGDYLRRDLNSWADIGLKFDLQGATGRLVSWLEEQPLPEPPAMAA